ncbi:hypothetical protein H0H87_003588, partial [Tephrocybe sp. NHM501043]
MHLVYRPSSSPNVGLSDQPRMLSPTNMNNHAHSTTASSSAGSINGMANIAPWDEPPTPPPKPSRGFGFPSKPSFSTFNTFRTGSSSTLLRHPRTSDSHSTLSTSEGTHRLSSADDDLDHRGRYPSTSSTVLEAPPAVRKSKSSIFSKLRSSRSKSRLRADSGDQHPSLHNPPPIPDAHNASFLSARVYPPSLPLLSTSPSSATLSPKKSSITKKSSKKNSEPQPGDIDPAGLHNVLNWQVNDLIADGIIGAGGQPAPHPSSLTSSDVLASSPSSTDHSSFNGFSNPFLPNPTPVAAKRTGRIYNRTSQRISPKDLLLDKALPVSPIDGSLPWTAPESWGVEGERTELDAAGAEYESSVDDDFGTAVASTDPALKAAGLDIERPMSFALPPADLDLQPPHLAPMHSNGKRRRKRGKNRVTPYTVRIYKDDDQFHEATMPLTTTVAELVPVLNEKLFIPKHETYRLYVRERGRERLLGMTEKPANIIKRRLEHHGYDANDGIILLRGERYRGKITDDDHPKDKQVTINSFENVDLEGRTLVAIPIAVHKNAEKVVSLKLSGNPMLEIPLDFVQSCTSLLDLRLSNMSLKSVPKS